MGGSNRDEGGRKAKATRVCQLANLSPQVTKEQLQSLCSNVGRIEELRLYPTAHDSSLLHKMAFVRFAEAESVETCQHMTNTVFIDRALVAVPVVSGRIPDEEVALKTGAPALPGQRQLPPTVTNQITHTEQGPMILTIDPQLTALGLPGYPPLPSNTEAAKLEEIRRTVYIGNIPLDYDAPDILAFFGANIGEVMYVRTAGSADLSVKFAYLEFSHQRSVPIALQNNGIEFEGAKLRIQHSKVAIVKPQAKTEAMAAREIAEAVKTQGAQATAPNLGSTTTRIMNSVANRTGMGRDSRSRSPSSPSRPSWRRWDLRVGRDISRRSRSRSPPPFGSTPWGRRRSRSRSKERSSRRSRSKERKSRSKRSRSRSKDRRSRSKERRRRSRSKERSSRSKRDRKSSSPRRDKKGSKKDRKDRSPEGPAIPPELIKKEPLDEAEEEAELHPTELAEAELKRKAKAKAAADADEDDGSGSDAERRMREKLKGKHRKRSKSRSASPRRRRRSRSRERKRKRSKERSSRRKEKRSRRRSSSRSSHSSG